MLDIVLRAATTFLLVFFLLMFLLSAVDQWVYKGDNR